MGELLSLDTRLLYCILVLGVATERGVELVISRRNALWALRQGGVEAGASHYPWMVALHGSFLVAAPMEVWLMERPFVAPLAAVMTLLLGLTMFLRYWAIATLRERWNTRVICVPGLPRVRSGPYRWMRHPNYLAVVVEIFALPMIHTAWLTALVYSLANVQLLRVRIRVEEEALAAHTGRERRSRLPREARI